MQIRKRDEEKRSKVWKSVMSLSTVIILLVLGFFLMKPVWNNPLKGEWINENGYSLEVKDNDEVILRGQFEGVSTKLVLKYDIDKKEKMISVKSTAQTYEEAADQAEGVISAREIDASIQEYVTAYEYSVDGDILTLTEREYGEQYIFTKK